MISFTAWRRADGRLMSGGGESLLCSKGKREAAAFSAKRVKPDGDSRKATEYLCLLLIYIEDSFLLLPVRLLNLLLWQNVRFWPSLAVKLCQNVESCNFITIQVIMIPTRFHWAHLTWAVSPIRGAVMFESLPFPIWNAPCPARQAKSWQASLTQALTSRPPGGGQRGRWMDEKKRKPVGTWLGSWAVRAGAALPEHAETQNPHYKQAAEESSRSAHFSPQQVA